MLWGAREIFNAHFDIYEMPSKFFQQTVQAYIDLYM